MMQGNRDSRIIMHILDYCDQIQETMDHFGRDYEIFSSNRIYRNAIALCILQIGELVGNLTDEFKTSNPQIKWRQIKGMRNIMAHRYGSVAINTTWDVITVDIPRLTEQCKEILKNNG